MKQIKTIFLICIFFTTQKMFAPTLPGLYILSGLINGIVMHVACPTAVLEMTSRTNASSTLYYAEGYNHETLKLLKFTCPHGSVNSKNTHWRLGACTAVADLARIEAQINADCKSRAYHKTNVHKHHNAYAK